jgi:Carboxypeptidase regulatory-like domain
MKVFQLLNVSVGATLALGALTTIGAAERLANVVQRARPWAGATTNAAKSFRLAGTVVDTEGKPVAGAVVECYQNDYRPWGFGGDDMEPKQRVTTGASGAFEFRVPPQMTVVLARKQGLAPTWNQYPALMSDQTEERLPFVASTTISGVVVDEADKPVADAEVWVSYALCERRSDEGGRWAGYLGGKPLRECLSTRTTADGKFVIQAFPTNTTADLGVSKPGKVLRELDRQYVGPDSMRCQAGQQDVKLVVEPAGNIEGKVVAEETGEPLAGATLLLQHERPGFAGGSQHEPARSAADGAFRLADVAAGTYQLRATFGTNAVPEWVAETVSVAVEAGQTASNVKVTATHGGFLEVAVMGQDDHKPLGDASVNAFKRSYTGYAASGSDGLAFLRVPKGEYRVSAYKENSRSEVATATVEGGRTNHLEIAIKPPPRITGMVRDAAGAPAPGLELSIFPQWGQSGRGVKTDANGRYEMPWNPQRVGAMGGSFCLLARDVAHNLAAAEDIEEGATTLDLRLQPGLIVTGKVQDENGRALTNATVRVFLWSGNSGTQFDDKHIRADARGQFEITALPPGRKYSLDATAKGYGSANQNIAEEGGTNRVELEPCVLRVADRKLAGEVLDADDKPVARANVFMYGPGQPNGSVRTDNKGRFGFEEVCEGTVQLSANLQNTHGSARAEAGDTNVVIRLGANQVYSFQEAPRRASLKGKPLPDLAPLELEAAPAGKPVLLCLLDVEQRPSRRFARQLSEQHDALKQKGVTVLGLQAAVTSADALKEWKQANPVPFPVGRVAEKSDKTKWAADVESLPWLILTDGKGRVAAEGFALEELDAKLALLDKAEQ